MTDATRLGQAFRRLAANSSIRRVKASDADRVVKYGATSEELNARFRYHVEAVEAVVKDDSI